MKNNNTKQVGLLFNNLGITTDDKTRQLMSDYVDLLLKGTEKVRLTGEKTVKGIIEKQLYDAIIPLKYLTIGKNSSLLDLGTGGGLPGIPFKIIRPDLKITLLDSNRKKALFLKEAVNTLKLTDVVVINSRAEVTGHNCLHRESYNYVLCRAVAKMAVIAELSLPLLKIGGEAIIYKGPGGDEELNAAKQAIKICGGSVEKVKQYTLKTGEKRKLYIIKKINVSPELYPRRPGLPGKRPITS